MRSTARKWAVALRGVDNDVIEHDLWWPGLHMNGVASCHPKLGLEPTGCRLCGPRANRAGADGQGDGDGQSTDEREGKGKRADDHLVGVTKES